MIIGSVALKASIPGKLRTPKDLDFVIEGDEPTKSEIRRAKLAAKEFGVTKIEYLKNPVLLKHCNNAAMIDPHDLLALKMSHLFWDIEYEKHLKDVCILRNYYSTSSEPLFQELYKYWETVHGPLKRSDLKMSKEEFFDNQLTKYDHDELHEQLAKYPAYKKFLKDGEEVEICKNKWDTFYGGDRTNLIREEVMVMAFERYQEYNYLHAYNLMLKKYLQLHAPLFVARWAFMRYNVIYLPSFDFIKLLKKHEKTVVHSST